MILLLLSAGTMIIDNDVLGTDELLSYHMKQKVWFKNIKELAPSVTIVPKP